MLECSLSTLIFIPDIPSRSRLKHKWRIRRNKSSLQDLALIVPNEQTYTRCRTFVITSTSFNTVARAPGSKREPGQRALIDLIWERYPDIREVERKLVCRLVEILQYQLLSLYSDSCIQHCSLQ
ncbi:hypothetical protein Ac2012v2_004786 [Leucoagaricus gongylophorus]